MPAPTYTINIPDITAVPQPWLGVLLTPLLDRTTVVNAEPGRFDGMAALVKPDIAESEWPRQSRYCDGRALDLLRSGSMCSAACHGTV